MDRLNQASISRKNFLIGAAIGAAGIIGMGALAQRKLQMEQSLPLGIEEGSIFKPRADALERMKRGLGK
jgi:hypothetical protein